MLITEKITLFMAAWMIFIFLLTINIQLEIFFILIFLGFLIAKVFTAQFTPIHLRVRMNLFILIFFIVFIVIISNKIINILNM